MISVASTSHKSARAGGETAPKSRHSGVIDVADEAVVVFVGRCTARISTELSEAAQRAGCALQLEPDADHAARAVSALGLPVAAVIVPHVAGGMVALTLALRAHANLTDAFIVALADELDDIVFAEAFSAGIDDCCKPREQALAHILQATRRVDATPSEPRAQRVVVADENPSSRAAAARAFRRAGFRVDFAGNAQELAEATRQGEIGTVVVSAALAQGAAGDCALDEWARATCADAAWIVNTPPRQIAEVKAGLAGADGMRIEIHDAYAVPASLLFVSNALRSDVHFDQRRNARMLYGTSAYYRPVGRRDEHVGFTYNISEGGLFVRTLFPPELGERLWLEMVPPRSTRHVHLEVEVVWRRRAGREDRALVPPGFGVKIVGGTEDELNAYRQGCSSYGQERAS